jgi:isopenicillin N synthase-like dioxygenase
MLATEHYFKSTTHRVVNPTGAAATESRFSMPLFLHARKEVRMSDKYTAGEYLTQRLKEIGIY